MKTKDVGEQIFEKLKVHVEKSGGGFYKWSRKERRTFPVDCGEALRSKSLCDFALFTCCSEFFIVLTNP